MKHLFCKYHSGIYESVLIYIYCEDFDIETCNSKIMSTYEIDLPKKIIFNTLFQYTE